MEQNELTPVQRVGEYWLKRDDLFEVCGVKGGKARAAYEQIKKAVAAGAPGIVTAGLFPKLNEAKYIYRRVWEFGTTPDGVHFQRAFRYGIDHPGELFMAVRV